MIEIVFFDLDGVLAVEKNDIIVTCMSFYKNLIEASLISLRYKQFEKLREKAFGTITLDCKILALAKDLRKSGLVIDKKYNLSGIFDPIIVSSEEKITKHKKTIFERGARKANTEAINSIFIDKNHDNCLVAERIRINSIHFDEIKMDYKALYKNSARLGVKI